MLKQLTTGLLVLLGILGMAAGGVLLAHRPEGAPAADWAIGLILGALSYMVAYGLTHAEPR